MKSSSGHPEILVQNAPRRAARVHPWIVAAIGVHFLIATVASASDCTLQHGERTKVRRISESVVQVLRELVDRNQIVRSDTEPVAPGFRVIDGVGVLSTPIVVHARMLDEWMLDLPPPAMG
jgi:hypothetical protein